MRLKIIAIFSVIVIVLSALGFAIASYLVGSVPVDPLEASRALQGASIELDAEGMATESWLAGQAKDPAVREPFTVAENLTDARGRQATIACGKIRSAAAQAPELLGLQPDIIALVDPKGVVLGRDTVTQMRGDDLGKAYPEMVEALAKKSPTSTVWLNKALNHQHLASVVPVLSEDGKLLGGVVFASLLNDARLSATSNKTSGRPLILATKTDGAVEIAAKSDGIDPAAVKTLASGPSADALGKVFNQGDLADIPGLPSGASAKAKPLDGYSGASKKAVLIAVVTAPTASSTKILLPVLGVGALGLLLVAIAGFFLDAYIMRPVAEIEDGLLAIINGQTNRRFEIVHAELGGVVFRLNSLLNQLFGVTEDDTDEEGRPSTAPTSRAFEQAIAVDESMAESGTATPDSAALRDEPEAQYYSRIFREYVSAKKQIGDPTDHITEADFVARIRSSEQETGQKHGKPVRYKVELKGREVILIAIPLA